MGFRTKAVGITSLLCGALASVPQDASAQTSAAPAAPQVVKLPDIESIAKRLIETAIKERVEEWARQQALALAKSLLGPGAVVDHVGIESELGKASAELPTVQVTLTRKKVSFGVPVVVMKTKTVAKLHVPELYTRRERGPDIPNCTTRMVLKHIALGLVTRVPEVRCEPTPTWIDLPATRMALREIKTDIPEILMQLRETILDVPSVTTQTTKVSLHVPVVRKITFDLEGAAKSIIPGGEVADLLLKFTELENNLRAALETEIVERVSAVVDPHLAPLRKAQQELNDAMAKVEHSYTEAAESIKAVKGNHDAQLASVARERAVSLERLQKELEPIVALLREAEEQESKLRQLVHSVSIL